MVYHNVGHLGNVDKTLPNAHTFYEFVSMHESCIIFNLKLTIRRPTRGGEKICLSLKLYKQIAKLKQKKNEKYKRRRKICREDK